MSLWLDMLGTQVRFVPTKTFGDTRVVEAGMGNSEKLIFMHGIGGHLEAYARALLFNQPGGLAHGHYVINRVLFAQFSR